MPFRLKFYSDGVATEAEFECSSPDNEVNHGVVVVGYGNTSSSNSFMGFNQCNEYWIVRNSWGRHWGQDGFFKLCSDIGPDTPQGTCLINSFGTWPTLA